MKNSLKSFVKELLNNQVITPSVAEDITHYYQQKQPKSNESRILGIFGVLGALLTGVGLVLIVAHNWDMLSRSLKSTLSILPVIIGIIGCGFALFRKPNSFAWREGSSVFLIFAFGACIALISQIYNIPGSLKAYMLTWVVSCLPLVYIMNSRITSLLSAVGVVVYGCMAGYDVRESSFDYYGHWLLLAALLPYYFILTEKENDKNATYFHHWLLPGGIAILLGTIAPENNIWLLPAYFSLFAVYYLISSLRSLATLSLFANGYRIIGSMGMIIMLLIWSFREPWKEVFSESTNLGDHIISLPFITFLILFGLGLFLLFRKSKTQFLPIMDFAIIIFSSLFLLAHFSPAIAAIGANVFLLVMGVGTIKKGSDENHLGIVNYGLLVITALIICRFFDTDIPFIVRGLLFIAVGAAFFFVNYRIIQNRKSLDS